MVITTKILLQSSFNFVADPCYDYKNLSDASRKSSYKDDEDLCDDKLQEGWYRFVGAAGTKMPTTRVPALSCGTTYSGWLIREDAPPFRKVCFSDRNTGCKNTVISLRKNVDPTIFTNFMRQNVQGVIVVQTECEDSCTLGILRSRLFLS